MYADNTGERLRGYFVAPVTGNYYFWLAADNAVVAIEELTVHGWDLARATGQPITVTDEQLDQIDRFQVLFGSEAPEGHGVFGPWATASANDRWSVTLAHLGRNPAWSPAG